VIFVGTYAAAGGEGLYPLGRNSDRSWRVGAPALGIRSASYGAYSARYDLHYLVDEENSTVGVFRFSGEWQRVATMSSGGAEPCYIALDPAETAIAVANFASGTLALYRLDEGTGVPIGPPEIRQNVGSGPHPERQKGPHAHCARFSPDGKWLFQTDLGTDEVLAFRYRAANGELGDAVVAFAAPPGSGPRHLIFSPSGTRAYLISELASSITCFEANGDRLAILQTVTTLPAGHDDRNLGGDIILAPGGQTLYATNRGHDSIAIFAVGPEGYLDPALHVPSGGGSPRCLLVNDHGRELFVANEEAGNVRRYLVGEDGCLTLDEFELRLPGAAFLFPSQKEPLLA
jgi:6-phosphogluconolactonase